MEGNLKWREYMNMIVFFVLHLAAENVITEARSPLRNFGQYVR
jgi:hypothetical protein